MGKKEKKEKKEEEEDKPAVPLLSSLSYIYIQFGLLLTTPHFT